MGGPDDCRGFGVLGGSAGRAGPPGVSRPTGSLEGCSSTRTRRAPTRLSTRPVPEGPEGSLVGSPRPPFRDPLPSPSRPCFRTGTSPCPSVPTRPSPSLPDTHVTNPPLDLSPRRDRTVDRHGQGDPSSSGGLVRGVGRCALGDSVRLLRPNRGTWDWVSWPRSWVLFFFWTCRVSFLPHVTPRRGSTGPEDRRRRTCAATPPGWVGSKGVGL